LESSRFEPSFLRFNSSIRQVDLHTLKTIPGIKRPGNAWRFTPCERDVVRRSQVSPDVLENLRKAVEKAVSLKSLYGIRIGHRALSTQLDVTVLKMLQYEKYISALGLTPVDSWKYLLTENIKGFSETEALRKLNEARIREFITNEEGTIDNLYPTQHLISWEDETKPEDHEWSLRPAAVVDQELLSEIKQLMKKRMLPDVPMQHFDYIDAMYLAKQQKEILFEKKGTSQDIRGEEGLDISFPDSKLLYEISKATKRADESRTIAISEVSTRNINYCACNNINKVMAAPFDYRTKNTDDLYASLCAQPDRKFILVDHKKFGWQVPTQLIQAVYETAHELYPEFIFGKYAYLLGETYIRLKGEGWVPTTRGSVLGMNDNVFGFVMSCIFEVFIDHNKHFAVLAKLDAGFKGDDSFIRVDSDMPGITDEVFRAWVKFLKRLGMIINVKKTKISLIGQFCEIYGWSPQADLNRKTAYLLNFYNSLFCTGIYECKLYCRAIYNSLVQFGRWIGKDLQHLIDDTFSQIFTITGPEFGDEEITLPFEIGGWISVYDTGLNTCVEKLLDGAYAPSDRGYFSVGLVPHLKIRPLRNLKFKKKFEEFCEGIPEILKRTWTKPVKKNSKMYVDAYMKQEELRQKAFRTKTTLVSAVCHTLMESRWDRFQIPIQWIIEQHPEQDAERWSWLKHKYRLKKYKDGNMEVLERGRRLKKTRILEMMEKQVVPTKLPLETIDKVRANLLWKARLGETNDLQIRYDRYIPTILLWWSMEPWVHKAQYWVPVVWYNWCTKFNVSLAVISQSLRRLDLNVHTAAPRVSYGELNWSIFNIGDPSADSIGFDESTGLPLKIDSVKVKQITLDLRQDYWKTVYSDVQYYWESVLWTEEFQEQFVGYLKEHLLGYVSTEQEVAQLLEKDTYDPSIETLQLESKMLIAAESWREEYSILFSEEFLDLEEEETYEIPHVMRVDDSVTEENNSSSSEEEPWEAYKRMNPLADADEDEGDPYLSD
jgi:hypothetical protein